MSPPAGGPLRERYVWHWVGIGMLVAGLVTWGALVSREPTFPLKGPRTAPAQGVDWFLLVKIPEIPTDDIDTKAARTRFTGWLKELADAGFQPMALSTVLAWLDRGQPLPHKTVVLFFHPGYRRTYEEFAPILAEQGYPAVWTTDRGALRRSDHRYVSNQVIRKMRDSEFWDVAWCEGAAQTGKTLVVELEEPGTNGKTRRRFAFGPRVGNVALNRGPHAYFLHQLRVQPAWSPQELVDRLLAEAPVERPSHLTVRRVGSRTWGVAIETEAAARPQPFDLKAALHTRSGFVSWPSTHGKPDGQLRLQVASGFGDVWVLLRSDRSAGQGVRVGFVDGAIVVEQDEAGQRTRLATIPRPPATTGPLTATMALIGDRLEVAVDGQPAFQVESLKAPAASTGMVEFMVFDKVRGAAAVQSANLVFVPTRPGRADQPAEARSVIQMGRQGGQIAPLQGRKGFGPVGSHRAAQPAAEELPLKP